MSSTRKPPEAGAVPKVYLRAFLEAIRAIALEADEAPAIRLARIVELLDDATIAAAGELEQDAEIDEGTNRP